MVSRVGKFVGGFNQDVTNTTNAHATENRVAFGHGDTNPTANVHVVGNIFCLLYTSPSPRDATLSRMPSSA